MSALLPLRDYQLEAIAELHRRWDAYRRADKFGEYWHSEEPGSGRGTYAWHDLLFQRGPVRDA